MGIESGAKIGKVLAKEKWCPKGFYVKRIQECVGTRHGSAQVAFIKALHLTHNRFHLKSYLKENIFKFHYLITTHKIFLH